MPTVLANVSLSLAPDRSYAVRGDDRVAAVSPMYNEEAGAARALLSLLDQDEPPDEIVLSINGGTDATSEVVDRTLRARGYLPGPAGAPRIPEAEIESWRRPGDRVPVTVVSYRVQTGKADSLNNLVAHGVVSAERIVVLDGDTVLHPGFVRALKDNFYRLWQVRDEKGVRFVLEDYAMQSGVVTSFAPKGAPAVQRFISAGREAEYAFGQVLKRGQTRRLGRESGRGKLLARSRLYTVVGCGFAMRRDLFPVPWDTRTEDHDLTLASQDLGATPRACSAAELSARGFRVVTGGKLGPLEQVMDRHDPVELVRGGNARLVEGALMRTEDPPHLSGFLGQLERWNGGAQQNALKRLGKPLAANVSYVLWSSVLENLLGILLLCAIPLGLALHWGNPSIGISPAAVGLGFAVDIAAMTLFVLCGLYRYARAEGRSRARAAARALGRAAVSALPFTILRYMNPLAYVASASVVLPHYSPRARLREARVQDSSWRRPAQRQRSRTQSVFLAGMFALPLGMASCAWMAQGLRPVNAEAWRLIYQSGERVDIEGLLSPEPPPRSALGQEGDIRALLFRRITGRLGQVAAAGVATPPERGRAADPLASATPSPAAPSPAVAVSDFCDPASTANLAGALPETAWTGDAAAYEPLGRGRLLVLARFVPLSGLIANAARAYEVPPRLLLSVLLNESYLDPLAVGPTQDKGLSQMTAESLTMLRALSRQPGGRFYNPQLFPASFNVFDPDFSACAGAAKLAWALAQPGVDGPREAYALYINPVRGLVHGEISAEHRPLTASLAQLEPMVDSLLSVFAVYRVAPERLSAPERRLMDIAAGVAAGRTGVTEAYRQAFGVVQAQGLPDEDLYRAVFRYYGGELAGLE